MWRGEFPTLPAPASQVNDWRLRMRPVVYRCVTNLSVSQSVSDGIPAWLSCQIHLTARVWINPLLTIYRLLAIHKDMAETIHDKVKRLRDAGLTFEEIGGAINKTRQRAYQLYQEAVSSKIQ